MCSQPVSKRPDVLSACSGCHQSKPLETLLNCGGCAVAHYCSEDCQKSDWSAHKPRCLRLQQQIIDSGGLSTENRRLANRLLNGMHAILKRGTPESDQLTLGFASLIKLAMTMKCGMHVCCTKRIVGKANVDSALLRAFSGPDPDFCVRMLPIEDLIREYGWANRPEVTTTGVDVRFRLYVTVQIDDKAEFSFTKGFTLY